MAASEAQIAANRANALKSTGPRTEEGKAVSRANAYTHGLTATKVVPEPEAAEVRRRTDAFCGELKPEGEVGLILVRHAASMSVRMERCAEHDRVATIERVRRALADFVPPEGVDEATAARLKAEAAMLATLGVLPESALARKYEAAAERSFLRCLKELRLLAKAAKAAEEGELGFLLRMEKEDAKLDQLHRESDRSASQAELERVFPNFRTAPGGRVDVPITIGRRP